MTKTGWVLVAALLTAQVPFVSANEEADRKSQGISLELTIQAEGMPTFDWDQTRPITCDGCPRVLRDATLAPEGVQDLQNGASCQAFVWTGEKPRVDTRPVLGIVYIYPECLLEWSRSAQ